MGVLEDAHLGPRSHTAWGGKQRCSHSQPRPRQAKGWASIASGEGGGAGLASPRPGLPGPWSPSALSLQAWPGSVLAFGSQDKARVPALPLVGLEKMPSRAHLADQCQDIPSFQLKRNSALRNFQGWGGLLFTPLNLLRPIDKEEQPILSLRPACFLPDSRQPLPSGLVPRG